MKLTIAAAAISIGLSTAASAQSPDRPGIAPSPTLALLNVTAEGRSERAPDLASLNAGVIAQGKVAGEALAANSRKMDAVLTALRQSGIAERDIQTSTLSLQPQYSQPDRERPERQADGTSTRPASPAPPRIIGYEARNTVTVRLRRMTEIGRVIDALVAAGANQVDGPYFSLEKPDTAADEARADAMRKAIHRAELYAREGGFRNARILTVSEGGGYYPVARDVVVTGYVGGGAMAPPPPPPPPASIQPGEMTVGVSLSVQFALER